MTIEITVFPGQDKTGITEDFDPITFAIGQSISIVGPTGSGKTAFINDIELLAQGDTATGRRVLVDGRNPSQEFRGDPSQKPVAMITQNTKCFTDLTVEEFIRTHARARNQQENQAVDRTLEMANEFTGEAISLGMRVTCLSGGQTRSLMIADAMVVGAAPIILLDEVENAGIFKHKVVETVKTTNKIIVFVTHDPVIALLTDKRIVMSSGGVRKVIFQNPIELWAARILTEVDSRLGTVREDLRQGKLITEETIHVLAAHIDLLSEAEVV